MKNSTTDSTVSIVVEECHHCSAWVRQVVVDVKNKVVGIGCPECGLIYAKHELKDTLPIILLINVHPGEKFRERPLDEYKERSRTEGIL